MAFVNIPWRFLTKGLPEQGNLELTSERHFSPFHNFFSAATTESHDVLGPRKKWYVHFRFSFSVESAATLENLRVGKTALMLVSFRFPCSISHTA